LNFFDLKPTPAGDIDVFFEQLSEFFTQLHMESFSYSNRVGDVSASGLADCPSAVRCGLPDKAG
jgi:hypothetical protein